jgi:hypothetical protein
MTRAQRRVHLWAWAVLGALVAVGMIAGICVRPRAAEAGSGSAAGAGVGAGR